MGMDFLPLRVTAGRKLFEEAKMPLSKFNRRNLQSGASSHLYPSDSHALEHIIHVYMMPAPQELESKQGHPKLSVL